MAETLYRKYRPQTFADVAEQNHVKVTLQNQILRGSVAHAYVLSGPRGVGKTTLARVFAKALNCLDRKSDVAEPCNVCQNCLEITEGHSMDVLELDAASHTGVDDVRERIIEAVRFQPVRGKYKVFIIDEAHMLSNAAFNALLKTLEEPPSYAVFILASTELHKFPETILSRCQRFALKKIQPVSLVEKLKTIAEKEGIEVDDEVFTGILRRAEGGMRDAESILGQILALGEKHVTIETASLVLPVVSLKLITELLDHLSAKRVPEALGFVVRLVDDGIDLTQFLAETVAVLRTMLLAKATGNTAALEEQYDATVATELRRLIVSWTEADLVKILERMMAVHRETKTEDIMQLPLEIAIVELCGATPVTRDVPPTPPSVTTAPIEPPIKKPVISNEVRDQGPDFSSAPRNDKTAGMTTDEKKPFGTLTKTLVQLQQIWNEVINKVSETSSSLPFILKLSNVTAVEGNMVKLAFQYPFHADTFNKDTNRRIVEEAFASVCGESCRCTGVATGKAEAVVVPVAEGDAKLKAILDEFGGKVVG